MSSSPRLVPSYQDIIENVDLEPLNTIPWFGWMTALSSRLLEATENLKEVVSIKELTALKGGVSKLLLCTVMPNLPCDLPYPTASKHKYDFSHDQKLSCVDVGVRVVLVVSKSDHLRSYVMQYLGELLCALLYLNTGRATQTDSEQARAYYQQSVTSLLDESYQPTVFTHLMILLTAKGDGGRISRIARKILDTKLQREGGINALVAATLLANDSPSSDLDVTTVSNLLVSKRTDLFYRSVLPQINLENEDSYLYLSAIEGLSSLAAAVPDQVLHQLCHEFANKKSSSIHRLKIGEVLLRTVKIMGDGGASHQDALLASFLTGVGDSDPLVRASSLSNIGEVARVFSFCIQTYIIEVLGCVERIVDCDEDPEPRRAAILLLGLLIQGLGKNALTVMGDLLPPLYRKLKQVYTEDRDEVTRLHAQVALDHFTHLMRGILLPDPDSTHTMSIQDVNK